MGYEKGCAFCRNLHFQKMLISLAFVRARGYTPYIPTPSYSLAQTAQIPLKKSAFPQDTIGSLPLESIDTFPGMIPKSVDSALLYGLCAGALTGFCQHMITGRSFLFGLCRGMWTWLCQTSPSDLVCTGVVLYVASQILHKRPSLPTTATEPTAAVEGPEEDVMVVEGAGGVGQAVNGTYRVCGLHRSCLKFKKVNGSSILYWNEKWRLNNVDDTRGWYYTGPRCEPSQRLPPEGTWNTEGYDHRDAEPAPKLRHAKMRFPASPDGHDYEEIWVTEAGGRGKPLNGRYLWAGKHKGHNLYRKLGGTAQIFLHHFWKMTPSSLTGWFYATLNGTDAPTPPEGEWTTHGYGSRDVLPAPRVCVCRPLEVTVDMGETVVTGMEWVAGRYRQGGVCNERPKYEQVNGGPSRIVWVNGQWRVCITDNLDNWLCGLVSNERHPPAGPWAWNTQNVSFVETRPSPVINTRVISTESQVDGSSMPAVEAPIAHASACRVGERVRVLAHIFQNLSKVYAAVPSMPACDGREGTIVKVDTDNTIRICLDNGCVVWLSPLCCTKTNVQQRLEAWTIEVRGAAGPGAELNGHYEQDGYYGGKPLYRQRTATDVTSNGAMPRGVMYYGLEGPEGMWRLSPGFLTGWFYSQRSTELLPPEGRWTPQGFSGRNNTPEPLVRAIYHGNLPPIASSAPSVPVTGAINDGGNVDNDDLAQTPRSLRQWVLEVSGAGGVGAPVNGIYTYCGYFEKKPKFRQVEGEGVIYFDEEWKINYRDDVEGWYYCHSSQTQMPPTGLWTTDGYHDNDADPAPTLTMRKKSGPTDVLTEKPAVAKEVEMDMLTDMSSRQPACTNVPMTCLASSSLDGDAPKAPDAQSTAQSVESVGRHPEEEEGVEEADDDMVLVNFENPVATGGGAKQ
jgi:hypothetical protein